MPTLQQLLGLPGDETAEVTGATLRFAPMLPVWVILVIVALAAVLAWRAYRTTPEDVPTWRRRLLLTLRAMFLLLLLGVALRPAIALDLEREQRRTVAVLFDASASMGIADPRESEDDRERAKLAGDSPTRSALAGAVLADPDLALLDSLAASAKVARYTFGSELAAGDDIDPEAPDTALGDALAAVGRRHSADDLAAVFLISDGASNEGESPLEAAAELRERGVRVFAYGVGVTGSRDVSIESLDLQSVALAGDAVPISVRVNGRGLAGQTGRLSVTLAGAPAAEKEFELDGSANQEVSVSILPARAGEFEVTARVDVSGGEVLDTNNSLSQAVRVLDSAIRVLMVETVPRWEFKYIQAMLLREQRIDLDCFLARADSEVTRIEDSPYLAEFPTRREQLFGYDLILFGDCDPRSLPPTAPAMIAAYVSEGGGSLAALAGKRFMPDAYRNTALVPLLPVELPPTRIGATPNASRPIIPSLTEAGRAASFMRLDPNIDRAEGRWSQLPPIYSVYRVDRAKPGATTYLSHPEGWPIVTAQRYGAGEVLWIGTDNTWRWRKNNGDIYHARFWGQVVQKLAGRRLAAGSRRTELSSDRTVGRAGEAFQIYARLLDKSFSARTDETVTATLEPRSGEGSPRRVSLRAVPGSPGYYRAEFAAGDAGRYRLAIPDDPGGGLDLTVRGADREFAQTAMDEPLLRAIADTTGGAFLREESLYRLPELAQLAPTKISVGREAPLWSSPFYLILLLLPLTLEWILRKFCQLK